MLPGGFTLAAFRSRGTARALTLEVALDCAESTDVAAIRRVGEQLAGALTQALPGTEINLAVNTVTIAVRAVEKIRKCQNAFLPTKWGGGRGRPEGS